MELKIRHEYLLELTQEHSRKTVGKILKRFEVIENKDILKSIVKELLYESYRDLVDLLIAGGRGIEQKVFKYNNK